MSARSVGDCDTVCGALMGIFGTGTPDGKSGLAERDREGLADVRDAAADRVRDHAARGSGISIRIVVATTAERPSVAVTPGEEMMPPLDG